MTQRSGRKPLVEPYAVSTNAGGNLIHAKAGTNLACFQLGHQRRGLPGGRSRGMGRQAGPGGAPGSPHRCSHLIWFVHRSRLKIRAPQCLPCRSPALGSKAPVAAGVSAALQLRSWQRRPASPESHQPSRAGSVSAPRKSPDLRSARRPFGSPAAQHAVLTRRQPTLCYARRFVRLPDTDALADRWSSL